MNQCRSTEATDDLFDYGATAMTAEEYAAYQLYDSVVYAAKRIPMYVFMDEKNWNNPVIALAYKLFEDELAEGEI